MTILPGIEIQEIQETEEELKLFKEVAWDFKKNKPLLKNGDFKIVEGLEAVKVWIYKALKTNRFKHEIFSWDFGSELDSLVNKQYTKDLTKAETERYIKEALSINEYITEINGVEVDFKDEILSISFTANTLYGEVEISV